jgi:hypothetical protein
LSRFIIVGLLRRWQVRLAPEGLDIEQRGIETTF